MIVENEEEIEAGIGRKCELVPVVFIRSSDRWKSVVQSGEFPSLVLQPTSSDSFHNTHPSE